VHDARAEGVPCAAACGVHSKGCVGYYEAYRGEIAKSSRSSSGSDLGLVGFVGQVEKA
jgi:hypothetical protein